ncbi:MAG: hypothetical protein ACKVE4_00820 [Dissulfuribacterales bacterium]
MRCKKKIYGTCFLFLLIIISLIISLPAYGVFFEKKFVVCKDNGQEILCDSYIVKKNDYVTKLFRQRGEISSKDFPKFLAIFKRLNTHIKDINKIYPNQKILVPLKILAPDTLEGQETGTVMIPVITITNVPRKLLLNSMEYVVHEGDCVSKLIADGFGGYSTASYKEAIEIFRYLNPEIKNLNLIHPGEKIKIPDPSVRKASWYQTLFNEAGKIVVPKEEKEEEVKESDEVAHPALPEAVAIEPAPEPQKAEKVKPPKKSVRKPVVVKKAPLPSIFKKAAKIFQAELMDKGEYFFPRQGQTDFKIDLSVTPVMEFKSGMRLLFVEDEKLVKNNLGVIATFWKNVKTIPIVMDESLRELMNRLCLVVDKDGCENKIDLKESGVNISVRGEYIFDDIVGPGSMCITMIENRDQNTPVPIQRYLKNKKITISDWIDNGKFFGQMNSPVRDNNPSQYVALVKTSRPAAIIKELSVFLGFRYQEKVAITFPYAGFQVKTVSNFLSVSPGKEVLVDYGDLCGDAVEKIETTGFRVVEIDKHNDSLTIIKRLLDGLQIEFRENPTFWTAKRPRIYNTSVTIAGLLFTLPSGRAKFDILITSVPLNKDLAAYFNQSGVQIVRIKYY